MPLTMRAQMPPKAMSLVLGGGGFAVAVACASFDQFPDFEARGDACAAIAKLVRANFSL